MSKALLSKPFRSQNDLGKSRNNVIAAEKFCLVDENGAIRATLSVSEALQPRLLFYDKNGRLRLSFYIKDDQPGIELLDRNEQARAALGLGDNGQPSLLLLDGKEKVHAAFEMGEDGGTGLDLYDPEGKLRATFSLLKGDDFPNLALIDKSGRRKISKSGERNDVEPLLVLYDKDGEMCDMMGGERDEGSA